MSEAIFRSDMSVDLVKHSASDADVIWAARVSTAGEQSLDEIDKDPSRSAGLINYLARERHGSPFEHTSMTFFISAPIGPSSVDASYQHENVTALVASWRATDCVTMYEPRRSGPKYSPRDASP